MVPVTVGYYLNLLGWSLFASRLFAALQRAQPGLATVDVTLVCCPLAAVVNGLLNPYESLDSLRYDRACYRVIENEKCIANGVSRQKLCSESAPSPNDQHPTSSVAPCCPSREQTTAAQSSPLASWPQIPLRRNTANCCSVYRGVGNLIGLKASTYGQIARVQIEAVSCDPYGCGCGCSSDVLLFLCSFILLWCSSSSSSSSSSCCCCCCCCCCLLAALKHRTASGFRWRNNQVTHHSHCVASHLQWLGRSEEKHIEAQILVTAHAKHQKWKVFTYKTKPFEPTV